MGEETENKTPEVDEKSLTNPKHSTKWPELTPAMYRAAELVIAGEMSLEKIAEVVGVKHWNLKDLSNGWRSREDFRALMDEIGENYRRQARNRVRRRSNQIISRLVDAVSADHKVEIVTVSSKDGRKVTSKTDWSAILAAAKELREWMKPDPTDTLNLRHGDAEGNTIPQQQVVVYLPDNGRTKGLDRSRLPVRGDIRGELAETFGNTGGDDNGDGNGGGGGE